jgi:hypothetical protein
MAEEQTKDAPRDTTPVLVNLDVERMYRAEDTDTTAVTVGPGPAVVPKWVAEAWGVEYKPAPSEPGKLDAPKPGAKDRPEPSR